MCNKTKVDRVRKKVAKEEVPATSTSPLKGRLQGAFPCTSRQSTEKLPMCFFCDALVEQDYHKAATQQLDANVRKMATELNDTLLLEKLSSGDMIAMDAVYHKHCLTALFTRHRSSTQEKVSSVADDKLTCEAIAFAELISYIEEMRRTDESIVKLSNVVHLYKSRLEQLGGDTV